MSSKKNTKGGKQPKVQRIDTAWKWTFRVAFSVLLLFSITARIVVVDGSSMESTYHHGNILIGLRPVSAEQLEKKYLPVCVVKRENDDRLLIKRLIGKPGDEVRLINGDTYVNGELVMKRTTQCYDNATYQLEEDCWLFMGDNRAASSDGRYWPGHFLSYAQIKYWIPGSCLDAPVEL